MKLNNMMLILMISGFLFSCAKPEPEKTNWDAKLADHKFNIGQSTEAMSLCVDLGSLSTDSFLIKSYFDHDYIDGIVLDLKSDSGIKNLHESKTKILERLKKYKESVLNFNDPERYKYIKTETLELVKADVIKNLPAFEISINSIIERLEAFTSEDLSERSEIYRSLSKDFEEIKAADTRVLFVLEALSKSFQVNDKSKEYVETFCK